jgi:heat shock protein HtpX
MNTLRTIVLMGVMTALMVAIGGVLGGRDGIVMAFIFACVTNIGSFWFSAPIALRMSGAVPIEREQNPGLYDIVERIAAKAQIPVPKIYMIPTESPNAFATGRDPAHSAVAVTEGIMQILSSSEMEAVLSHELGHVKNRDVLISTIAAVMASVVTMIAHYGMYFGGGSGDDRQSRNPIFALLLMITAPIAATLINLAISRSREYEADATGAQLCGHPLALASALSKIESVTQQVPMRSNPALSSLYIMKPDPRNWFVNIFSTHPPTAERIARLEAMAHSHSQ